MDKRYARDNRLMTL